MWHFRHVEKWNAPEPLAPGIVGCGLPGSEPSWHATHDDMGGAAIERSDVAVFVFVWHCSHDVDCPFLGSLLCVLWLKSCTFDGGRPAFFDDAWQASQLFICGTTWPPTWHWQQFGWLGCATFSPPLMRA